MLNNEIERVAGTGKDSQDTDSSQIENGNKTVKIDEPALIFHVALLVVVKRQNGGAISLFSA